MSSNGEIFLIRCFGQDQELAASTNRLLVIGFYLINLGFISYRLNDWHVDTVSLIPEVGSRVGISLLVLGAMHFFNMLMIARFGRVVKDWVRDQKLGCRPRLEPDRRSSRCFAGFEAEGVPSTPSAACFGDARYACKV